jgi:hypothetical protein
MLSIHFDRSLYHTTFQTCTEPPVCWRPTTTWYRYWLPPCCTRRPCTTSVRSMWHSIWVLFFFFETAHTRDESMYIWVGSGFVLLFCFRNIAETTVYLWILVHTRKYIGSFFVIGVFENTLFTETKVHVSTRGKPAITISRVAACSFLNIYIFWRELGLPHDSSLRCCSFVAFSSSPRPVDAWFCVIGAEPTAPLPLATSGCLFAFLERAMCRLLVSQHFQVLLLRFALK